MGKKIIYGRKVIYVGTGGLKLSVAFSPPGASEAPISNKALMPWTWRHHGRSDR